jgi:hypothetical protein
MNEDILNKLPPDARKEFINVALKLSEKKPSQKSKMTSWFLLNMFGQNL